MKILMVFRGNIPCLLKLKKERNIRGFPRDFLFALVKEKDIYIRVISSGVPGQKEEEIVRRIHLTRIFEKKSIFGEIRTGIIMSCVSIKEMISNKYDIFHVVGEPMWHAFGIFVAKFLRIPIILTSFDPWYELSKYEFKLRKRTFKQRLYFILEVEILAKILEKIFFILADKIICVSSGMKDNYTKKGILKSKLEVIPNGVDANYFQLYPKKEFPEFIIGYLGCIHKMHGIFELVDIFYLLKEKGYRVKLLYIGDGPDLPLLKHKVQKLGVEEYVEITGWVDKKKVIEFLTKIDVGYIGWKSKMLNEFACPLKVIEYWAMGKPVVGKVGGDIKKLIEKGAGIYLESLNPKFASSIFEKLIRNKEILIEMGRQARKIAVRNFSWEVISQKYLGVYKSLLK